MSTFQIRRWDDLSADEVRNLPLGAVCMTSDGRRFERVYTTAGLMWCEVSRLVHEPPPPRERVEISVLDEIPFVEIQQPPPSPFADTLAWLRRMTYSVCTCEAHEVPPTGRALGASVAFYCPHHGHTRR